MRFAARVFFWLGFVSALMLLGVSISPAHAREEDQEALLALGSARISGGNLAAARRQAVSNALTGGVEEYLLRSLGPERISGRLAAFARELIPSARDEIANFNIVAEEEVDGNLLVLVRLKVNQETLAAVLEEKGFDREKEPPATLLLMVDERHTQGGEPTYWWKTPDIPAALLPVELALIRSLEEMGFAMEARAAASFGGEEVSGMDEPDLSDEAAAAWGRACGAGVVIAGRCELGPSRVRLGVRAVDSAAAEVISRAEARSPAAGGGESSEALHESIRDTAARVASKLGPEIREALSSEAGPARLEVLIQGLRGFSDLRVFRRFLEERVSGVESMVQTLFKSDSAGFSVDYKGSPEGFAEGIANHPDLPFPVEVNHRGQGKVVVTIR